MINATDSISTSKLEGTNNCINAKPQIELAKEFAPKGQAFPGVYRTEHGYYIRLPKGNIGGDQVTVKQVAPNQYLVVTKKPVYNSTPKYELYTEAELVKKYNGQKGFGPINYPILKQITLA